MGHLCGCLWHILTFRLSPSKSLGCSVAPGLRYLLLGRLRDTRLGCLRLLEVSARDKAGDREEGECQREGE